MYRGDGLSLDDSHQNHPLIRLNDEMMDHLCVMCSTARGAYRPDELALHLDASHVCAVDISPRALEFLDHNCLHNSLDASRLRCVMGDIASYAPDERFDWLFANPPFVPTPEGIDGGPQESV